MRESVADVARTLAGYCAVIAARVFDHATLEEMAAVGRRAGRQPALRPRPSRARRSPTSSRLQELLGGLEGRRLVYVGDGNNVAASLAYGAALSGVELTVASPPGLRARRADVVERARNLGGTIELVADPYEAVRGADAVYTDVWTSMGQEDGAGGPPRRVRRATPSTTR